MATSGELLVMRLALKYWIMSDSRAQSCLKSEIRPKNRQLFPLERNLQYSSPQCNRIGEEFNFKSVREKSDERYGFNRSRKTMPGSDGVDTPGRSY